MNYKISTRMSVVAIIVTKCAKDSFKFFEKHRLLLESNFYNAYKISQKTETKILNNFL